MDIFSKYGRIEIGKATNAMLVFGEFKPMKIKRVFMVLITLCLILSLLGCANEVSVISPEVKTDTAAEFIASQLENNKTRLYVYNDFADGRNYYTQKAFMGDNYRQENIPPMNEAAEGACIREKLVYLPQ
jgi:hypothetical protein